MPPAEIEEEEQRKEEEEEGEKQQEESRQEESAGKVSRDSFCASRRYESLYAPLRSRGVPLGIHPTPTRWCVPAHARARALARPPSAITDAAARVSYSLTTPAIITATVVYSRRERAQPSRLSIVAKPLPLAAQCVNNDLADTCNVTVSLSPRR